ncbi:hypothetical protein D3P07_10265 [Paenibacillus sp. 1011MAR3C5]|uniref:alpha/beta hydrolase fold domain-containing protein n=1 Tax=Paenibacillus sp. 1011MAR3C5 TaxID=1675787 RepID=UPI000E6B99D6|nr:alpha/beta hydrolase fold domain-containing protein [Paenibacillus sp. 1011MAR3C5]RJE88382.1 hypothetical protein D3P07_10265 [Paenibacillus sp. 1011MAR3C5]
MRTKKVYLAVLGLSAVIVLAVVLGSLGSADRGDGGEGAMKPQESGTPGIAKHEDWLLEPAYQVKTHRDLVYVSKANELGKQESLALDLYEPNQEELGARPLILFIHGGGFNSGDKRDAEAIAKEWASRGYVVASANYRLRANPQTDMKGTIADAIEDMGDALSWLQQNKETYRIDTRLTAVGGDSAGGQLAVTFASRYEAAEDGPGLFAVIDMYGPLFRGEIQNGYPSTLIIHGTADAMVPYQESVQLFNMLEAAQVYRQFITMEGGGHSYQDPKVWGQVVQSTVYFLRNAISAPKQIFLPEQTELAVSAGDEAKLTLWRQPAAMDAAGSLRAELPEGWELAGQTGYSAGADTDVAITVPEDTASGLYPILMWAEQNSGKAEWPLTLYVKVKERLSYERTVYYNSDERQIYTRLAIENKHPRPLQGRVVLRYQNADGTQDEVFELETLQPGGNKEVNLPFYSEDPPTINYENPSGARLQETPLRTHVYAAEKREEPLTIDGSLEDWHLDNPFPLNRESQVLMQEYGGASDLSGQGYVSWDEDYVYLALEMKDDHHVQQESGFGIYLGDSVQFSLKLDEKTGAPQGVHELGAALREGGSASTFRWLAPQPFKPGDIPAMKAGINRSGEQTIYEIALPWSELGVTAPSEGLQLKFSLLVNDNDGQGRKGWMEYNSGIGYKDERAFGDLFLVNKRN